MQRQKCDKAFLSKIKSLASVGMTITDIADRLQMSRQNFYAKANKHPEMWAVYYEGMAISKLSLMEIMHSKAVEGNIDAAKFLLSRLHGLTEKTEQTVTFLKEVCDEQGQPLTGQALIERAQTLIMSLKPKELTDGGQEQSEES